MSDRLRLHLERMLECSQLAAAYAADVTREAFLADRKTQQAIVLNLMVIGETANRVVEGDTEFVARYPALPWTAMRGMRNRIAHGYFDIDMGIVWETVQRDPPLLIDQLMAAHQRETGN